MKEHTRTQFIDLGNATLDKLAVGSFGKAGSGKTRLILTMPGKIGAICLDRKSRRTIERGAEQLGLPKGKIVLPKEDFVRLARPMELAMMTNDNAMVFYREHVNRIKDAVFTLAERSDIDSIAIDSGTQMTEDVLFANYGRDQKIMPRDRGLFNSEMKQLFAGIQNKHVLVTHEARAIWLNDKPTKTDEWTGWSKLPYNVSMIVEHFGPPHKKGFELVVRLCQDQPDLIGQTIQEGEDIDYEALAMQVWAGE